MRGMLRWVSTASTPGARPAALVSIDIVRPFAIVLWTIAACATPASAISAV
jgi:hypothetical protein